MNKHYLLFFLTILLIFSGTAQEIRQFTVADFDLKGAVKTCQVITDYGQEIFEFDSLGRLVKVTTQYNEEDKDITSYKYALGELIEKRVESYKDNVLDLTSSMAYFYSIDSTDTKKIKEQIISYDKEFVEIQEYHYNEEDKLVKVITSHENAVDEMRVEHSIYKNEQTTTYFENEIIQKSIRASEKNSKKWGTLSIVLTKTYLDGEPIEAEDERRNQDVLLISKEMFRYNTEEKEFATQVKHLYSYDNEGVLSSETITQGNSTFKKEYIFQFDANEEKNWVKKIITPDNSFATRQITYYPTPVAEVKMPE